LAVDAVGQPVDGDIEVAGAAALGEGGSGEVATVVGEALAPLRTAASVTFRRAGGAAGVVGAEDLFAGEEVLLPVMRPLLAVGVIVALAE
jgi:hypothetical protein